ncbi:ankyrin repeat-containing protein At2g01680-like [Triticum dicoccoides]|uniref:ankyrin repeat-containing protein At2g01680-like n=1 Tax=Triticum dicoccoides TaxID=85692 RepID=UPI0018900B18|nr:ankyrin repeat-containing protein At2g01680-like [Triticum dicoccoides]
MASGTSSPRGQEPQQLDKELLKAAKYGDSTHMQAMASQDRNILHGKTLQGNTCLHISCIYGHVGFCKDVLELEDSLISAVNLDEETPLITSVRNGHVSLASFLLGRHCSVHHGLRQAILQQDRYGFNALHHAISNGQKDLALELIEAEPALSQAVGKHNESPMFFAVMRNFTPVYEKLLQNPLSACSGGQHCQNCLHAAVMNGDQEFVKLIMKKRPELAREVDTAHETPIALAVRFNKIDILQLMLEHDSTLGYLTGHNGFPLLHVAAHRGQVAAARMLLEHCPDAPYIESDGLTCLHIAVWFDQPEFVEFVLRTPILRKLVNVQDNNGKTALHNAVTKCNPRIVAALLSHVDIDATLLDNHSRPASWELSKVTENAKTLNWNEVAMLISKANPQNASVLHNLQVQAKRQMTDESRKNAKSLTQTYTSNTSLVAILIATITFAAAFTLPGGYSNDAGSEGLPIMSRNFAFQAFLISDVLAMCSSFAVAFICIIARWEDYEFLVYYTSFTKKLMWFAYVTTTTAFSTSLYTVLAPRVHWLAIAICVMVALLPILTKLLGEWPILKLRLKLGKDFNSDFRDMV